MSLNKTRALFGFELVGEMPIYPPKSFGGRRRTFRLPWEWGI